MRHPEVILHKHKTEAAKRFHPWVFSGAIKKMSEGLKDGDLVVVKDEKNHSLGVGHYASGSIAVRIFSFDATKSIEEIFRDNISEAIDLRKTIGLWENKQTNAFRLIHGEGDSLPGLIVDVYANTAVLQAHSLGMHGSRQLITDCLLRLSQGRIKSVYDKSSAALHTENQDGLIAGEAVDETVMENGLSFKVDVRGGQKTGFFLDQRNNRKLLAEYALNRKTLNTFCYTGGFSIYALKAGAALVHSVDASAKAMQLTDENVALNQCANHRSFTSDVFDFLKNTKHHFYELMILDPPAFAKHHNARHQAIQAYKRLNAMAFEKVSRGGIVFTFSCSQAVNAALFEGAVTAGAIEAKRNVKILHRLTQPPDHPVSIFHPEGEYLKGLVLSVE